MVETEMPEKKQDDENGEQDPEILERIRKTKEQGSKELKFYEGDLIRFPPELCDLTGLEELHLPGTLALETIPDDITKLVNLRILVLPGCYGERLPSCLGQLPALEILVLEECPLEEFTIEPGSFPKLKRLEITWVSEDLKEFKGLGELQSLEELSITGTCIPEFPAGIAKLKNLKELYFDNNVKLREIPSTLGELEKLEYLSLKGNFLTSLPPELGNLRNLKYFNLFNNVLEILPEELGELEKLEELNIEWNFINWLPPGIWELPELKVLRLHGNDFEELPSSMGKLRNLEELGIGDNPLTKLPNELSSCRNLKLIKPYPSKLKRLPPGFKGPKAPGKALWINVLDGRWEYPDRTSIKMQLFVKCASTRSALEIYPGRQKVIAKARGLLRWYHGLFLQSLSLLLLIFLAGTLFCLIEVPLEGDFGIVLPALLLVLLLADLIYLNQNRDLIHHVQSCQDRKSELGFPLLYEKGSVYADLKEMLAKIDGKNSPGK